MGLTEGSQQLPNRPALRLTTNVVPASVHFSSASSPMGYTRSPTTCLVFFLPGVRLSFFLYQCVPLGEHQGHLVLRTTSSVGTS